MGMAARKAAPRYKKALPLLTQEYLMGIPVFTRRYFEELFRRLKPPAVIVLDNYQDAPIDSGFHEMLVHGLDAVPEGITILVLSRIDPPPPLARLQANNKLHLIGWDDIRFTREEAEELLKAQGQTQISSNTMDLLHTKTEGWAAGLVLLMAGAGSIVSGTASSDHISSASLFDYFASEIFNKADTTTQDVLLKTSFLQRINSSDAEQLTENKMAGQILERLSRHHYFTQKYDRTYQYHPLFREFLLNRANDKFYPGDLSRIRISAGALLAQSGQIEEAVSLFRDAGEWNGLMKLVLDHAQALVSQGRSKTLEEWIISLPKEFPGKFPWLLYWFGVCRLPYNPAEARGYFEKAFLSFKKDDDVPGLFLSWACIADTFFYEWSDIRPLDRWIEIADKLMSDHPEFHSSEINARFTAGMLNSLTWRQPAHPDLSVWVEKAWQIVLHQPDNQLRMILGNHLVNYHLWIRDFAKAGLAMDVLRRVNGPEENSQLMQQHWHTMETIYYWVTADAGACMRAVQNGMRNAEDSGIHLLDLAILAQGVASGITLEDPVSAADCLAKMSKINSPRILDKALYNYQTASVAWYHGDFRKAIERGRLAVKFIEGTGAPLPHSFCLMDLAMSLFEDGQHKEAKKLLARGGELARGMNALEFAHLMHGARFAFDLGEEEQGLALLRQGMGLGSREGYVNMFRWNNRIMSGLCAKALAHGIETGYVRNLIARRGLVPEQPVENWPYSVKIYTLGGFKLLIDDKPVEFTGKVQKKPLEMLKALIALGGKEVSERQLADVLWPDAEGDLTHKSFEMTLLRLRKLLGKEGAVQLKGGLLGLDPRYCWVDVRAIESIFAKISDTWKSANASGTPKDIASETIKLTEKAIEIYKGGFLELDVHQEWAPPMREKIKSKIIFLVTALGRHWEQTAQWNKALECFQKGLDIDDLTEELYQHMMACYEKLGQKAEAVKAYKKCSSALSSALGITPSGKTEAVYARIIKNR
jgi:DNA-binding SARP family transcriptional activator